VSLGGDDITDTPKAFNESGAASGLRVVVTPQTGSVSGVVLDTNGRPKAGARVVLFSADARQWHVRSRGVATAEAGAAGHYAVRGLLPGRYMAAVVDRMADGAWEDPDVLGRLQLSAVAVTITAGAAQTLDWRPR
jgi:protocatechuate 3,4-dioxygenase beta subunit